MISRNSRSPKNGGPAPKLATKGANGHRSNGNGRIEEALALIPIRFTEPQQRERELRTMVFSGMVEYTSERGVFKVPRHTLQAFKENNIGYEPTIPKLRGKV